MEEVQRISAIPIYTQHRMTFWNEFVIKPAVHVRINTLRHANVFFICFFLLLLHCLFSFCFLHSLPLRSDIPLQFWNWRTDRCIMIWAETYSQNEDWSQQFYKHKFICHLAPLLHSISLTKLVLSNMNHWISDRCDYIAVIDIHCSSLLISIRNKIRHRHHWRTMIIRGQRHCHKGRSSQVSCSIKNNT